MKIRMSETLLVCGTILMCYSHTATAYTLLSLGILSGVFRFGYYNHIETEKAKNADATVESIKGVVENFISGLSAMSTKGSSGPWN